MNVRWYGAAVRAGGSVVREVFGVMCKICDRVKAGGLVRALYCSPPPSSAALAVSTKPLEPAELYW